MSGWTPGPWVAVSANSRWIDVKHDGVSLLTVWGTNVANQETALANAKLIAAAPEMAEVLERIAAGKFDCAPHQRAMAMEELARAILAHINGDAT